MADTPWGSIGQTAVGLAQTIGGWVQQRKATKQLEKLQSPTYTQNQSVMDLYSKALQRYNANPTDSAMYKRQMNNIGRGTNTGLNALQSRRSALGGISSLIRGQNDATLNAEVSAEGERSRRFGELGSITGMKQGEDQMAFQINQQQPYERKFNLLAQKAGGGNQVMNSGIANVAGGLQSYDGYKQLKKLYGG